MNVPFHLVTSTLLCTALMGGPALAATGHAEHMVIQSAPKRDLASPRPSVQKAVYTCPMHPEVTSDRPGDCPKCGMHLEKKTK